MSAEEFKIKLSSNERSERFFEIHLESMIRSPDVVIPDMLKFLGLKENEKVFSGVFSISDDFPSISAIEYSKDAIFFEFAWFGFFFIFSLPFLVFA